MTPAERPSRRRIAGEAARRRAAEAAAASSDRTDTTASTGTTDRAAADTGTDADVAAATDAGRRDRGGPTTPDPAREPKERRPSRERPRLSLPPSRTYRWLAPLAALTVVALVAALVLVVRVAGERADDEALLQTRTDAASAAASATDRLLSYSWRDLAGDREAALARMTPEFGATWDAQYGEPYCSSSPDPACAVDGTLAEVIEDRRQVSEVGVVDVATLECGDDCDPTKAEVLVFADVQRTSATGEPSSVGNRVVVSMVESDGTWLVDGVRNLQA